MLDEKIVEQQLNVLGYKPQNISNIVMELFHKYDIQKAENEQLEMFLKSLGYSSEDLDTIVAGNWVDESDTMSDRDTQLEHWSKERL